MPEPDLVAFLEEAIRKQEALDIFYRKTGRHSPEPRRVSPLLVEQRGPRFYLIACCHMRRANRTFRLDRLTIRPAPPPLPA